MLGEGEVRYKCVCGRGLEIVDTKVIEEPPKHPKPPVGSKLTEKQYNEQLADIFRGGILEVTFKPCEGNHE